MGHQSRLRATRRLVRLARKGITPTEGQLRRAMPPITDRRLDLRCVSLAFGQPANARARYQPAKGEERVTVYSGFALGGRMKNSRGPEAMAAEGSVARRLRLEAAAMVARGMAAREAG